MVSLSADNETGATAEPEFRGVAEIMGPRAEKLCNISADPYFSRQIQLIGPVIWRDRVIIPYYFSLLPTGNNNILLVKQCRLTRLTRFNENTCQLKYNPPQKQYAITLAYGGVIIIVKCTHCYLDSIQIQSA